MTKAFVNLHTHSFYSILEGTMSPKKILEIAKEKGHSAVALTDKGAGYGLVDFYEQSQKLEGVKPILGAEIFVTTASRFEKRPGLDGNEGYIVLLAQNKTGYQNLVKLISSGALEGFFHQPRVDLDSLSKYKEGLICLSGGRNSFLYNFFVQKGASHAAENCRLLKKIFGDQFYIELCARNGSEMSEFNQWLAGFGKDENIKFVATSDARFATITDQEAADTLYCIGKNQIFSDPNRERYMEGNWFRDWDEIISLLDYLDPALLESARENTILIAEAIDLELEFNQSLLPHFAVPEGETEKSWLRTLCEQAIGERYSESDKASSEFVSDRIIQERLDYELSIIGKMGFEAYFLIVADFIDFAKDNGISVGPGRGSAAGSIVSFLLGITNIDPLRYELLFERFLNPERISMPDIDIDFSDERRDEVLQYVTEKYTTERVSKVCTFGTLAAKAALKDVGRSWGIPFGEMNAMTKVLPNKPGFALSQASEVKEFTDLLEKNPNLKKIYELGLKLEGCVRHVSVHACAVIIGGSDLTDHAPVQWAPGAEEVKITQYPYQQLEHLGLLKMDFLGLKNLSVLEKALQNISAAQGIEIDLDAIPIDDEKTFQMMARGETTGVFQFESSGMRRYLKELKPTEFEDLVAMNALYRPGPMEYIPQYIKGKHEPESVKYMHDDLAPILKKTYGIAVYQEQVLRIAQEFAGFSLGEADILRKAIGKKIMSILEEQRQKFIEGAVGKGYQKKLAVKIFDDIIVPFSGYGFNRSHAVCYARIAYETAYLRANYPVEFMAAMMTTDRNNTDRIVLEMNECGAMEIEVLPPSVNQSGSYFTVIKPPESPLSGGLVESEKLDLASRDQSVSDSSVQKSSLRFGLTAIKGLGEETVNQIILERKANGKFKNLPDFAKRVPAKLMNKKTLEALAFSGAFDEFANRGAIVESLDELAKFAKDTQEKAEAGQMGLFGGVDEQAIEFTLGDTLATKEDILEWERDSLGLYVSDHPLKGLNGYFEKYGHLIGTFNEADDAGKKRTIHGLVTNVRKIVTKRGANMAIIEVEDTSGKIEGAIFPKVYESVPSNGLVKDAFVRVRGKVEERDGSLNFIVDEVKVGDLKSVQGQAGMFTSNQANSEEMRKPEADMASPNLTKSTEDILNTEPYEIIIPEGTTKGQVDKLKGFLKKIEAVPGAGRPVLIKVSGQNLPLPFPIKFEADTEGEIEKIFKYSEGS